MLLIVLLSTEIFLSFADDDASYDGGTEPIDLNSWKKSSQGFQEGESKVFDFIEIDENWTDGYSEGGTTLVLCFGRLCLWIQVLGSS